VSPQQGVDGRGGPSASSRGIFEPRDEAIATLRTGDFTEIVDGLIAAGKLSEANHAFTAVKTMLRFCLGRGYIDRHPLEALKRP